MTSFRRSMSVMQRDGAVQNGEASTDDTSPSPKFSHGQTYLAFRRFLNSLDFLAVSDRVRAYVPGIFLQRPSRPAERSKPRGAHLRHAFFHFFICFMLGIFISFTPIFSVDMSKNFVTKQQAFSFEVDSVAENSQRKMYSVEKEAVVFDESHSKGNFSVDVLAKQDVGSEAANGDYEAPVSDAISPFEESELESRKLLIVVTPMYVRPLQAYYLNRLAHTLRIVPPPLLWIVVEMSSQSTETAEILRKTGVMYRHLVCNQNVTNIKDKGVHQRNVALSHIEKHQLDGIVYFADDDRMFSLDLFDQMRHIRRFGTWPIATLTGNKNRVLLEGPICNGSQVIGWHTNQRSKLTRRFHADMSGFAFNSTILWDPKRWHRPTSEPIRQHDAVKEGYQETTFIEQLVEDESQMEGFPSDCPRIMAWHLHLEAPELLYPKGWLMQKNLEVVAPVT